MPAIKKRLSLLKLKQDTSGLQLSSVSSAKKNYWVNSYWSENWELSLDNTILQPDEYIHLWNTS